MFTISDRSPVNTELVFKAREFAKPFDKLRTNILSS